MADKLAPDGKQSMDRDEAIRLLGSGPEGVAKWNQLRVSGGQIPDLKGVNLRGAHLEEANLSKANLGMANLGMANLKGAFLSEADLEGAQLEGAHLKGAFLRGADLRGAHLEKADLERAFLRGADLRGAHLERADLRGAHLRAIVGHVRGPLSVLRSIFPFFQPPFVLNDNAIEGTRFPPYIQDPWSVLRRTYTGPKLAFLVLFSLLAFLPLAGRAAFWITLSQLEHRSIVVAATALERTAALLRKVEEPARDLGDFITRSEAVAGQLRALAERHDLTIPAGLPREIEDLLSRGRQLLQAIEQRSSRLQGAAQELRQAREWVEQGTQLVRLFAPGGTVQVRRRPVWYLLLGIDRGFGPALLSGTLLLYSIARALLTYSIGPLRDEEERTGTTPAWADYRRPPGQTIACGGDSIRSRPSP
jgi:hypothetical protein